MSKITYNISDNAREFVHDTYTSSDNFELLDIVVDDEFKENKSTISVLLIEIPKVNFSISIIERHIYFHRRKNSNWGMRVAYDNKENWSRDLYPFIGIISKEFYLKSDIDYYIRVYIENKPTEHIGDVRILHISIEEAINNQ